MADKHSKLFTAFSPISTEEWEAKINADLKGRDYERTLVKKTNDGIKIRPYYRRSDLSGLNFLDVLPGEFPYVRGNQATGNNWYIRQDIFVKNFSDSNKKALNILDKGATSLGFCFDCNNKINKSELATLFSDIRLDAIELNFINPCENHNCISAFNKYIKERGYNPKKIIGSFSLDPIGSYLLKGKLNSKSFSILKDSIETTSNLSNFRIIGIHGKYFSNSGSSIVQELAFSFAQGVEYLTHLTDLGLPIDSIAKKIKFNFGIGNNYFMEIAKLRAARLLWANIVKAYNPNHLESSKISIHSETNSYNKTFYDPYVNMLRTQTEAMSAVLGGANSITVLPFDAIFEETTDFSERIARNQQILLKEEAHLDKISDPGAGSYYIENLTSAITEHSWNLFLDIQERGGFIKCFKDGFIQKEIKAMSTSRAAKVATRRENLLGVTQFPNFTETAIEEFPDWVFKPTDLTADGADTETLKPYRAAQPFELLRYTTDLYSKDNKRPIVFMLPMGNLAMRKARAQFSCNFFAVAGFKVIDNNGFNNVETGIKSAKENNADIIVVCSSDEEYTTFAPKISDLLDKEILVIAGNPKNKKDLELKGIKNFIHTKSNILEELKMYQKQLNII